MATYYEMHKALEQSATADDARGVVRQYAGKDHPEYSSIDDHNLMQAFVYSLCRLNGTHWAQEIVD